MYRLTLYGLIFLWAAALFLSFFRLLPFAPIELVASVAFITAVCVFTELIFANVYEAPANLDSVYITALILTLIISPAKPLDNLAFFAWAAILAMALKFIIAFRLKHIFNPAALSVALTAIMIGQVANWWVGNLYLAPFTLIAGFLIVRKIKRFDLAASFFAASLSTIILTNSLPNFLGSLERALLYSPLMFFAFIMLTEPMTTPPKRIWRVSYGLLTGFLFAPAVHLGSIYSTPELALLAGNIFSFIASPKHKLILKLAEKTEIAPSIYEYSFKSNRKMAYLPGQFMEWTVEHPGQDSRGIRRYFTLASSPTEAEMKLGVKFYPEASSFKKYFLTISGDAKIVVSQLAGDFVMPCDPKQKLVFMAGGIGITPFRSMIKYLLDTKEARSIILLYSNRAGQDIVYQDVFEQAEQELGIKTVYTITDKKAVPTNWRGYTGYVNEAMILKEAPDYQERMFYLSGPRVMVVAFEEMLKKLGVKKSRIKTDYFPGFA